MDVLKRIQELLEERNWTLYRLARASNLSDTTVTQIFKRNTAPTLPTLEAICKGFNITMSEFFSKGTEPVELTDESRALLAKWSTLPEEQQKVLL